MNNATEQFLEVELPEGAALWTAVVDNQPVKPIEDPKAAKGRRVLIPLVKTAAGDLDYIVTLKYGGQTAALGNFSAVNFPLVHAKNINAERSVVQLHLPGKLSLAQFRRHGRPGRRGRREGQQALLSGQPGRAAVGGCPASGSPCPGPRQAGLAAAVQQYEETSKSIEDANARVENHMKQVGLALHNYEKHAERIPRRR